MILATGANVRRWCGVGPRAFRDSWCWRVPYPALRSQPNPRIPAGKCCHDPVPGDLGDDRCGGNREAFAVTTDDCAGRAGQVVRQAVAVDQGEVGLKTLDGAAHGEVGGSQDVHPVNDRYAGRADADFRLVPEKSVKLLPP